MFASAFSKSQFCHSIAIFAVAAALGSTPSIAEDAPPASQASPEVYKVLAENDQFRVMEATWQPGQEDAFHSHAADRVVLYQNDCELQVTNGDGSQRIGKPVAGKVRVISGKPVASHKAKNIGANVCVIRFVEMK